jgi:heat shock protein
MEENDLNYTMTREQFEKVCEPIFNEIKRVLAKLKDDLKAKSIELHSIEMVGGGSRIPIFIQSVK